MKLFKFLFVLLLVKPLVFIGLGLNIIQRQHLPLHGPAVVAANHNSHLDTLVLLALFPISMVHKIRPVAAADYFLKNRLSAWLSLNVLGIIPIRRSPSQSERSAVFDECHQALDNGDILLVFPEGSRGEPEVMSGLKKGIYHLVKDHDHCPVVPVVMRGLGRALPKGTAMLVPFNCDVVIGQGIEQFVDADDFLVTMQTQYDALSEYCIVTVCDD
ncbi:glycerol acyltransferase [Photobacterium aquae]|uniref:Glycerol acyltransferase n=1 Tax=Photobacterium aquae TaxID=1195763 RepID=A0A0J1HB53_9GAMM|nr:lysophospholipid acyltransferase family protein [Photobacterium aquae]KLV08869.1 glycerol acyltransferase [Photobacterium aquae]